MLETLFKAWTPVERIAGSVRKIVQSPFKAETHFLRYLDYDLGTLPTMSLLSGGRFQFIVGIELTNRTERVAYVKRIAFKIRGRSFEWTERQPLRLEPSQVISRRFVFLADESMPPIAGEEFELEITPSVGRRALVKGQFFQSENG